MLLLLLVVVVRAVVIIVLLVVDVVVVIGVVVVGVVVGHLSCRSKWCGSPTTNHNPLPTTTHNPDITRNSIRKRRLLPNANIFSAGVMSSKNKTARPVPITHHAPCSQDANTPWCATVSRSTWIKTCFS
jgi:hypothetical protein